MTAGRTGRKRRFWVLPVLAAIPTLFVILLIFLLKNYDFPEGVVAVLFIAVVIPVALICEKLGLGQFNIMGGSTIPDWLFYSVMILLVYLYSLVLVLTGRGIVSLMGRVFLKVRGER
jgi:Mn2+/Fe2+ NRAMP family transporter